MLSSFEDALSRLSVDAAHADIYNGVSDVLVYNEGSANFNLFKITPKGHYIQSSNPMLHLWKRVDIDTNVLKRFETRCNSKYTQPNSTAVSVGQPYNLFLMQHVASKDLRYTIDALKYATEMKRFTIFKTHPAVGDDTNFDRVWEIFKSKGLISDYTVMLSGNMHNLIANADLVYSADSAGTFNAMLSSIPTVNYRINEFSEIVPLIETSKTLLNKPIPQEDLLRFLTWYHDVLAIDILDMQAAELKISRIAELYNLGFRTVDIF